MKTAKEAFDSVPDYGELALAGDWHGQKGWGKYMIRLIAESTDSPVIFHLGDFGFWPRNSGRKYLGDINKTLEELNKWLFVTGGNHEDYIQISTFQPVPGMPGCVYNPTYPRVIVFKRGHRWEWLGKKMISIGGANSIDKDYRQENISWWSGEQISGEDVYNSVQGGKVDVLFSHDAPAGVNIFGSHRDASEGWSATQLRYAHESREKMRTITDVIQPRLMFHGHYHMPLNIVSELGVVGTNDAYVLHSRCLDKDYSGSNIGLFDLNDEAFRPIEIPKPDWKFPYKLSEAWWLDDPDSRRDVWWV